MHTCRTCKYWPPFVCTEHHQGKLTGSMGGAGRIHAWEFLDHLPRTACLAIGSSRTELNVHITGRRHLPDSPGVRVWLSSASESFVWAHQGGWRRLGRCRPAPAAAR